MLQAACGHPLLGNLFLCVAYRCAGYVEIGSVFQEYDTPYVLPRIFLDSACQSFDSAIYCALCIMHCASFRVSRIDKQAVMRENIFPLAPAVEDH